MPTQNTISIYREQGPFRFYAGRIPVAFGLLAMTESPTDYLAPKPFESGANLIPDEWSSLGLAFKISLWPIALTTQLITGLDSTGFDSYSFVANGTQGRYGFRED